VSDEKYPEAEWHYAIRLAWIGKRRPRHSARGF
jgi:hypothetical protein